MTAFLLVGGLLAQAPAFAAKCTKNLRLSETHRIRDAWSPVLDEASQRIRRLDAGEVRRRFRKLELRPRATEPSADAARTFARARATGLNFDRMFIGQYGRGLYQTVGFSKYNRASMRALLRAVAVFDAFVGDWAHDLRNLGEFARECALLDQRSYSRSDVGEGFANGQLALLQAASWLTADAIEGIAEADLLRRVLSTPDRRASLAVQMALELPAELLGEYAAHMYVRHPVRTDGDDRLHLATLFRRFIDDAKERTSPQLRAPWHLGFGCPVAFRRVGCARSALQSYLDAILYLIDVLSIVD